MSKHNDNDNGELVGCTATSPVKPGQRMVPDGDSDHYAGLAALCLMARFHQIAADPATLAHQMGLLPSEPVTAQNLLRAAKHLGLKAKRVRSTAERLHLTLLSRTDTIEDSDGLGSIQVNGQTLTGGKAVSANAWQTEDKQWRYALTEQGDLVITQTSEAGRIIVHGWCANPVAIANCFRRPGRSTQSTCSTWAGVIQYQARNIYSMQVASRRGPGRRINRIFTHPIDEVSE